MEQPEITIRELRSGRFVACLPGSERIGPTVDSRAKAEAQVEAYLGRGPTQSVLRELQKAEERDALERRPRLRPDEPDSLAVAGKAEPGGLPDGYTVEKNRGWYTLVSPDGEQVGKSKRTPEEAAAQAPAE